MRPEDDARKLSKGQLAFGEKIIGRKIVSHKNELKILQRIFKTFGVNLHKYLIFLMYFCFAPRI